MTTPLFHSRRTLGRTGLMATRLGCGLQEARWSSGCRVFVNTSHRSRTSSWSAKPAIVVASLSMESRRGLPPPTSRCSTAGCDAKATVACRRAPSHAAQWPPRSRDVRGVPLGGAREDATPRMRAVRQVKVEPTWDRPRHARPRGDSPRHDHQPQGLAQPGDRRRGLGHRHGAPGGHRNRPPLRRIMNPNLQHYHVPVNADVHEVETLFVEEDDTVVNPLGVKGMGELGMVRHPSGHCQCRLPRHGQTHQGTTDDAGQVALRVACRCMEASQATGRRNDHTQTNSRRHSSGGLSAA